MSQMRRKESLRCKEPSWEKIPDSILVQTVPINLVQADDRIVGITKDRGVSRLLCKRPGFVFGMGCRGRASLPLPIDVEAFRVVIA